MAHENQPNDVAQQSDVPQPTLVTVDAIALGQRGASRRRFARAGAGATGVLLTLASQPGMACDICMSPSGYQSYSKNMTAASHKNAVTCTGRGPNYWRNTNSWPSGCRSGTMFNKVFSCTDSRTSQTYGKATCMKILTHQTFDSNGVGVYLMAMYLNVLSKKTTFMTAEGVLAIWDEYRLSGYYTPTAGVKWDASQIVFYLSGTMD